MAKIVSRGKKTWKDGSVMTYRITDDGILYVSGVLCDDCTVNIKSKASFHQLIVEEGVTSIGNSSFYGFKNLEEIILPSSLTSIGNKAFMRCEGLKEIVKIQL